MSSVFRLYVEKKSGYDVEAKHILNDIIKNLQINSLKNLKLFNRYDVEGVSKDVFDKAKTTIFSEPTVDNIFNSIDQFNGEIFAIEYLPGQYDQRADSCEQCLSLLDSKTKATVLSAKVFCLIGDLSKNEIEQIKKYLINPVESREASLDEFTTLEQKYDIPNDVKILDGFIDLNDDGLKDFINEYSLAMDILDAKCLQEYFKNTEKRNPTITEIRMIDTYWSDHCRHTTFSTVIENVDIEPEYIKKSYDLYITTRKDIYKDRKKDICLMDMATIAVKYLKSKNKMKDLDESEEINACSVKIKVDVNGVDEDWLLMFKNETHNHPTEIEPFGGAATCLGGAIRDPLSGRVYVYQAMRITGSGDPTTSIEKTIKGKLPQRKITQGAASGYSSYGNQIGLATGYVEEIYHEGYVAKRMEVGAVVGSAKAENVIRKRPQNGDIILLIGGKTGRDGCGGATGSSKSHDAQSINTCGAQVQKGNPPEERKIQRLFRNADVAQKIKRCNDFGAGGVSVAIGELADGLNIDLDAVTKKYEGLDGTELAISESQERMAVVVDKSDVQFIIDASLKENLTATPVAVVTNDNRLEMSWRGNKIVNISRDFLNSNGAKKNTNIKVKKREIPSFVVEKKADKQNWLESISSLNNCSQKGLVDRFDSTIGAGTVLMPFGGKNQLSPSQVMAAKIPVLNGETNTCSIMSYGFDPYLSSKSPYHGAMMAVCESVAKLIASGGDLDKMWLSFQEYFPKTSSDEKWGLPFEALLGAMESQIGLNIGAIGGKDSMSGTFEEIDVPPTLISFAISVGNTKTVVTSDMKKAGSNLFILKPKYTTENLIDFDYLDKVYRYVTNLIHNGKVLSSYAVTNGGIASAITNMCVGNDIGVKLDITDVFNTYYGAIIIETDEENLEFAQKIGETIASNEIIVGGESISLIEIKEKWLNTLEDVFPLNSNDVINFAKEYNYNKKSDIKPKISVAKPMVVIPVFPGTNCEYDTAKAFERAGANAQIIIIANQNEQMIEDSVLRLKKAIDSSNMVMIPGGFSGGDEPDGSGKFISVFLKNPYIKESVDNLLNNRDGLMLGICNGFQALIKLGLVPYGKIIDCDETCPTLTFNNIGRHQSMMVKTRISSNNSPWLSNVNVGDIHTIPVSHGEGKFVASKEVIQSLAANGQIATQYVDDNGKVSMDIKYNPNGSFDAIEGILSLDGRVLGKMGHSERFSNGTYKNIYGEFDQKIFESGVKYFK